MTAERTGKTDVPDVVSPSDVSELPETTELKAIITGVLEECDGLCMDEPEERERLGHALTAALSPYIKSRIKTIEPETEAAT